MKYKISKAEFEKLDEATQKLYKAKGDDFVLSVEGMPEPENVDGLKKKVDELLAEKKSEKEKREKAEKEAREAADKAAKESGDFKALYESSQKENDALKGQIQERDETSRAMTLDQKALEIASGLTKDPSRAKLIQNQLRSRLDLKDGQIKVLDASGALTVSSTDQLVEEVKKDFPFLVDGKDSSGGGSKGGKGGAGDTDKKTVTRAEFDEMDQPARSSFAKEGGKVVDD